MKADLDLTDIASISVEQFSLDGGDNKLELHVYFCGSAPFCGHRVFFKPFEIVEPGNPSLRAADASWIGGATAVEIRWSNLVGFIDNITFDPVPEPSTLALFALGLIGLAVGRWRIR